MKSLANVAKSIALRVPALRRIKQQRDAARSELDAAVLQRDAAVVERDAAQSERAEIKTSLDEAHARLAALQPSVDRGAASREKASLELLEGTAYSRYGIPVDYLPSRDFNPRWGHSRPAEPVLKAWFKSHLPRYRAFLTEMQKAAVELRDIPLQFDEAKLPSPAWFGVPYAPFDAVALYTMIRTYKPRKYVEIGSGITTCFAHKARRDGRVEMEITSIDPEPRARIDSICDRIERSALETSDLSVFQELEPNDIVFFDGSHRSFMNSDVTVFMIDVLPYLKPGVLVHIHDITLPNDYPSFFKNWYWNEQYLLAVYMMARRDQIDPLFPSYFVCAETEPMEFVDLGGAKHWTGGGAMWFTHR